MCSRVCISLGLLLLSGCATAARSFDDTAEPADGGKGGGEGSVAFTEDSSTPAVDAYTPPTCVYPSGPYGIDQGSVVAPTMTWQGYAPGASSVSTIRMSDYYDCDGTKGINALVVDTGAVWCGPCNQESSQLESTMQTQWSSLGVQVLVLLWQNASRGPAAMTDVTAWKSMYTLDMVSVAVDPVFQFAHPSSSVSLPTNIVIDPRTMKIVGIIKGYGGPDPSVSQLAMSNKH